MAADEFAVPHGEVAQPVEDVPNKLGARINRLQVLGGNDILTLLVQNRQHLVTKELDGAWMRAGPVNYRAGNGILIRVK